MDQMSIYAQCKPESPTIEVRNKAPATPAYWDESYHNSLRNLFVIENKKIVSEKREEF